MVGTDSDHKRDEGGGGGTRALLIRKVRVAETCYRCPWHCDIT